ncbi:MAG TPA: DinB family protein, partial [Rubricoccaceae bacterium]
ARSPRRLVAALDAHRLGLTARVAARPSDVVRRRPAPHAWSLAQLLDHLLRIDRMLQFDGPQAGALVRATSRARGLVVRGVLALPVRIPAPPGASAVMPAPDPDPTETADAWATLRQVWRARVAVLTPSDRHRVAFRHPIAGPLCLPDALAFVLAHHRHHDAQVRRTLLALGLDATTRATG